MKKLLIFIAFVSCIEPYDIGFNNDELNVLVVEGSLSTESKVQKVKLSRTAKYGGLENGGSFVKREEGAIVAVRDNLGNVTFFTEMFKGEYHSPSSFQGIVGRSYSLLIETKDGENFTSLPDRIVEVPDIDRAFTNYKEIPTDNPLQPKKGLELFLEFTDTPNETNFYSWTTEGTYQINTRPDLHISSETQGPDPLDCCATCWGKEFQNSPILFDDIHADGVPITIPLTFIEDDGIRYSVKYHVKINQRSMSKTAFEFFSLLNNQLSIDGDIFDPPPATIRGNVISIDNPDQPVIGFFNAYDVKSTTIVVTKDLLLEPKEDFIAKNDCRKSARISSTEVPTFW